MPGRHHWKCKNQSAYLRRWWIPFNEMTCYSRQFFTQPYRNRKKSNKALSSARVTSECAFGVLKARWRCLLNNLDCQIENVSTVIIASCVLHNICQLNKDDYTDNDGILEAVIRQERKARRRRRNDNCAPVNAIYPREAI